MSIGYAVNLSTAYIYTDINLNPTDSGIVNQKVIFPSGTRGKYINFNIIQNSTNTFKIYGIDVNYIIEHLKWIKFI